MVDIEVVDYPRLNDAICGCPKILDGPGRFEDWEAFHHSLVDTISNFCDVGGLDAEDVYHSGDWFDALMDGFSLLNTKAIIRECLLAINRVIAERHHRCTVVLCTEEVKDLAGMEIFISSSEILIGAFDKSADDCRKILAHAGIELY